METKNEVLHIDMATLPKWVVIDELIQWLAGFKNPKKEHLDKFLFYKRQEQYINNIGGEG